MEKRPPLIVSFPAAVIIYAAFACWLFYPYTQKLLHGQPRGQILFPAAAVIGATGVFVLCRRWVLSFFASLAGGIVFGFGTYACSVYCYHPLAGLINAFVPWFFVPGVFFYHWTKLESKTVAIISALLSLLPILFILCAYEFAAGVYFFNPIPVNTSLTVQSLTGMINPTGVSPNIFTIGFYHVSIAGLIMGVILLLETKRLWTIALFAITICAAFYRPLFNVPPVVWASIPVMLCSVMIAAGLEAIILAGAGDSKWLLTMMAILILFGLFSVLLTGVSGAVGLYGIGVAAVLLIFFIARGNFAWHSTRMLILYSAVFVDIIISTRHVMGMIF
jgi:hypothetical protein